MNHLDFVDEYGSFAIHKPENISYLYFPLAAETGLKSSITPNLGGDAKIDQETFLLEPVSAENLHNNRAVRNFWLVDEDGQVFSAAGASAEQEAARFTSAQDDSSITAGLMWQTLQRTSAEMGLRTGITAFCPRQDNVEILCVTVQNQGDQPHQLTPVAAIPLYGRSADNIRDHRNVTSMLHRIWTTENGVMVRPTMSFDERGHRPNHKVYYVSGFGPDGQKPEAFYPTVEAFLGEGGTYLLGVLHAFRFWKSAFLRNVSVQTSPFYILHGVVDGVVRFEILQHFDDVRMIQLAQVLRFPGKLLFIIGIIS